jgi:hypothetical protein
MFTSGENLLIEILTTNPPPYGPKPYNENDPALLASRSERTINTIKSLLEPLKKRRRLNDAKAAAEIEEHKAQQQKAAVITSFISGLQLTYEQAKGLLGDVVELLAAITAQVDEAAVVREAVFAQSGDVVRAVYTAHKRHYEVQGLLDGIVAQTKHASLLWLREFEDAKQALPLKMIVQARKAESVGWQKATDEQWPVVVATYELLVPLAERLKEELAAALAEDELWLAPLVKTTATLEVQHVANSRGARLAFANMAEVQLFVKEEIISGDKTESKTYQVCLAGDKETRGVVQNRIASLESNKNQESTSTLSRRKVSLSSLRKVSLSVSSGRRMSFNRLKTRKTSVSVPTEEPLPQHVPAEDAPNPTPEPLTPKSPTKKSFPSRLPVRNPSISLPPTRERSLTNSSAGQQFASKLPVRKGSMSQSPATKVGSP